MLAGCEFVQAVKSDYTYYTQNAHGDVVNLTDNNGAVTKTYQYDAFGVEKNIDDTDTNAFRYCGEYYDKETATIYLRARYYSPSTGRFISRDSFAGSNNDPLSLNLYTYCHNNPVSGTDSTGHFLDTFFDAAILAFDIVSFCIEPTPMGAVDILTDAVGLVTPGVPSAGLKVGVHAAETAYDAYKAVDTAHDLSQAADVVITVSKKGDAVLELADTAKDAKKVSEVAHSGRKSAELLQQGKKAKGWHVGDTIDAPTRAGTAPKWSTVRQRYWKNEAHYNLNDYSPKNISRMKKGLAPQQINKKTGQLESMELHHIKPQRENGPNSYSNLKKVWPDEHAEIDSYRHVRR